MLSIGWRLEKEQRGGEEETGELGKHEGRKVRASSTFSRTKLNERSTHDITNRHGKQPDPSMTARVFNQIPCEVGVVLLGHEGRVGRRREDEKEDVELKGHVARSGRPARVAIRSA